MIELLMKFLQSKSVMTERIVENTFKFGPIKYTVVVSREKLNNDLYITINEDFDNIIINGEQYVKLKLTKK